MTRSARGGSWSVGAVLCIALACSDAAPDDANVTRGRGLKPVALAPETEASVFDAVVRASFDVEPGLVLMAHPRRLPRTAGYDGGEALPAPVVKAMRDRGIVRGVCEPRHEALRDTPRCTGLQPGYVVRASAPVRVAGDTIQLNFAAEAYAAETGPRPQSLRFEKIYQLVGRGADWQVLREARVKEPR